MIILTKNGVEAQELFDAPASGVSGRFVFQAIKNGGVVRERAFDNLITNLGLDLWGTTNGNSLFALIRVGTGTSVPAPTDTQLQSALGSAASAGSATAAGVAPNYESTGTFTANWAIGDIVGNLTEVCIGLAGASNYAFSRALILDGAGVPTAFPIAADEQLRVTYVFKVWPPLTDQLTTQKIGSTTYDVLVRAYDVASSWYPYIAFAIAPTISTQTAYTGNAVASITSSAVPTGTLSNASSTTNSPYVNGTYKRGGIATASPTTWNGNIRTIINGRAGMKFQNQYTPAIPKTALQTLVLPSEVAWSRH